MRRIDKIISVILISSLCVMLFSGCGKDVILPYTSMTDNSSFKLLMDNASKAQTFASELCVGDSNVPLQDYDIEHVGAAGFLCV